MEPKNQAAAYNWIMDLYADVDPKTGYLIKYPKGVYGKKVKELVHYASSLSVEMKAIQHSRQTRTHPCCQYTFYVFQFLSDIVFPVVFAILASYMYYEWTPSEADSPILESNTTEWTAHGAGEWLGSSIRSVITVPIHFVVGAVDRGFHVEEAVSYFQSTGTKLFLLPLLFLFVYGSTKIMGRLLLHIQTLCSAHRRVWQLQELLIKETEEALERAISGIAKPILLIQYEQLLKREPTDSKAIVTRSADKLVLYRENLPMIRLGMLEQLSAEIKAIPFAELIQRGQLSSLYAKTIHALIRHADDELSATMFAFHEEINRIPTNIRTTISNQIQNVTRLAVSN
jgi:fumarate reductase subunit D